MGQESSQELRENSEHSLTTYSFAPLKSLSRQRKDTEIAWSGHFPFVLHTLTTTAPRLIVELGVGGAAFYEAFLGAAKDYGLETRCCTIACWPACPSDFRSEIPISRAGGMPSRMNALEIESDADVSQFEDGSIDILLVVGCPSDSAARTRWERWQSRMSDRGVVLFHGTGSGNADADGMENAGIGRFWNEIKRQCPHFEFYHCGGLGVVSVGEAPPERLMSLFHQSLAEANHTRLFFRQLGEVVLRKHKAEAAIEELSEQFRSLTAELSRRSSDLETVKKDISKTSQQLVEMAQESKHCREETARLQNQLHSKRYRAADKIVQVSKKFPLGYRLLKFTAIRLVKAYRAFRSSLTFPRADVSSTCVDDSVVEFKTLPWAFNGDPTSGKSNSYSILVVSHEASRTGAPVILLDLLRDLVRRLDCRIYVVADRPGPLFDDFVRVAPTLDLHDLELLGIGREQGPDFVAGLFRKHTPRGLALCNTVAIGPYYDAFARHGIPIFAWIHELPTSIDSYFGGSSLMQRIATASKRIVAPANFVRDSLIKRYEINPEQISVFPYGVATPPDLNSRSDARCRLRQEWNLPPSARIVVGCGGICLRKGADLFIQAARQVLAAGVPNVWFVWIGPVQDRGLADWLNHDVESAEIRDRVRFVGSISNLPPYVLGADIFLLTSREDPYPLVNIQALASGVPVIAFRDAGGAVDVVEEAGAVVPYLDVAAMARVVADLLSEPDRLDAASQRASLVANRAFNWNNFSNAIVRILKDDFDYYESVPLSISVIVPNYNHAPYLEERLLSLFAQTVPPHEIIVLDDCSTDDSVSVVLRLMAKSPVPIRLFVNEKNSGSPFRQWFKGITQASGDLVWIAESDDSCLPEFLERVVPEFYNPDVVLAYCQSAVVDARGQKYADNYLWYTDDLSTSRWRHRYSASGGEEVETALLFKNTIPNASAAVFRRTAIPFDAADELATFRFAGDWLFYAMTLRCGKIAFVPESLNRHRRHEGTVTSSVERESGHAKEILTVKTRIAETFPVAAEAIARTIGVSTLDFLDRGRKSNSLLKSLAESPELAPILARLRAVYDGRATPVSRDALTVLVIVPDLEAGGGQVISVRLANQLAKTHRVFLCNARPWLVHSQMLSQIDPAVKLIEGSLGPTPWSNADAVRRIEVLRELVRLHRVDIIDSHIWWADKLAYEVNRDIGLPWFLHMHGCYEALVDNPDCDPSFAELVGPMMASASAVFYGAHRNLRIFETSLAEKPRNLVQSFNGLDPAGIPVKTVHPVSGENAPIVFALVSRPIPEKGWEEAIQATLAINALPAEKRGGRSAKLVVVGEGPFADQLKLKYGADGAIEFPGQVVPAHGILARCDVGMLPSRYLSESVPLAIIDYLACGLPVIATDVGAIPQMIHYDGLEAGTVVPLRDDGAIDVQALTDAMLAYLADERFRFERQSAARPIFDARFHIDRVTSACVELYQNAARVHRFHSPSGSIDATQPEEFRPVHSRAA